MANLSNANCAAAINDVSSLDSWHFGWYKYHLRYHDLAYYLTSVAIKVIVISLKAKSHSWQVSGGLYEV